MDDVVITNMIIVLQNEGNAELQVYVENKVSTTLPSERLANVIANRLNLPGDDNYDLYIKLPKKMSINQINLNTIESIAVIPSTAGQIPFVPGKKK